MNQVPPQTTNDQQQTIGGQQMYPVQSQGTPQYAYNQGPGIESQSQYPISSQAYAKPQQPYNPNFATNPPPYPAQAGYPPMGVAPYPDQPPPYPGLPNP